MFEGLMKRFGYSKPSPVSIRIGIALEVARQRKADLFIDYVVKTNSQKIYLKDKKKTILFDELV